MLPKWKLALIALIVAAGVGGGFWYSLNKYREDTTVTARLNSITTGYRRILLLMDGAELLDEAARSRCRTAGSRIFRDNQQAAADLEHDGLRR